STAIAVSAIASASTSARAARSAGLVRRYISAQLTHPRDYMRRLTARAVSGSAHRLYQHMPKHASARRAPTDDEILLGENLELLPALADASFQLIYLDPPFNRGGIRSRKTLRVRAREDGERAGFAGRRYATSVLRESSFRDQFEDYLEFLAPRLQHARRLLALEGTLYFHIDYREAHHCKLLLDEIFGRECFLNEIIWAYDYGDRKSV